MAEIRRRLESFAHRGGFVAGFGVGVGSRGFEDRGQSRRAIVEDAQQREQAWRVAVARLCLGHFGREHILEPSAAQRIGRREGLNVWREAGKFVQANVAIALSPRRGGRVVQDAGLL